MKSLFFMAITLAVISSFSLATQGQDSERARLDRIEKILSPDVPRVLCLDENIATGGQPTGNAYANAAASGFASVLSLRTANEGVDLARERAQVEAARLRYFNIPVNSSAPRPEQADEFIRVVKDPSHHPMLINCASANRVGAFMMIYRVIDQGWGEDKALAEAKKIGLRTETLQNFAAEYIARHRPKKP